MSKRISIIEKEGFEILFLDYSNLKGDEYLQAIEETKEFVLNLPKDHRYDATISDSSNSKMNDRVKQALKDLDSSIKEQLGDDYQSQGLSISIGMSGLQKIIAGFMIKNVKFMSNKEEAIEYALSHLKSKK
jgi:hypothetical protein